MYCKYVFQNSNTCIWNTTQHWRQPTTEFWGPGTELVIRSLGRSPMIPEAESLLALRRPAKAAKFAVLTSLSGNLLDCDTSTELNWIPVFWESERLSSWLCVA